jgi:hypothetical protein
LASAGLPPPAFMSPHPHAGAPRRPPLQVGDTPPGEVEMERKLAGLRAARNVPPGEAAQMAMEEGSLRFDLERSKRLRSAAGRWPN